MRKILIFFLLISVKQFVKIIINRKDRPGGNQPSVKWHFLTAVFPNDRGEERSTIPEPAANPIFLNRNPYTAACIADESIITTEEGPHYSLHGE
jgi:hypothetical protein